MTRVEASNTRPTGELLVRYRDVIASAWKGRSQIVGPARLADEVAFLPAALSLQETPVHPSSQRVAWAMCALFSMALVWSIVGEIDIVAVAPGRIVVSDRSKTVQSLEAGIVKRVLVKDGDEVQAGQVLLELDATNASADSASVREQLANVDGDARRASALLVALRGNATPSLLPSRLPVASNPPQGPTFDPALEQLGAEWHDITAKLAKLAAEQAHRRAEITTVRELIAKLHATLPIALQREADFKSLTEQGFVSTHAGQDRMRERIEQERDLATQRARLAEAVAALAEAERNNGAFLAETQRVLSERQAQSLSKRQQLLQELDKSDQRSRLTFLAAPVEGTVQQLAVHTEGGVVTPAQILLIVVPKDAEVTAEVTIENKDIGYVNAGDQARIKLETFPFTRYGTVEAQVKSVTADAVSDEKKGAIFPAVLKLGSAAIRIDGKLVRLNPGMNLTAEIRTGRRRVIDYLLSPVQQALSESLGER